MSWRELCRKTIGLLEYQADPPDSPPQTGVENYYNKWARQTTQLTKKLGPNNPQVRNAQQIANSLATFLGSQSEKQSDLADTARNGPGAADRDRHAVKFYRLARFNLAAATTGSADPNPKAQSRKRPL